MDNYRENKKSDSPEGLSNAQKISLAVLAVFTFLVILLWITQLKSGISKSFQLPVKKSEVNNVMDACQGTECLSLKKLDLKVQDTDKDGISDWEELNIYKTSPYIEDSDSDGFTDKEEIDSKDDPNCPRGVNCKILGEDLEKKTETVQDESINNEKSEEITQSDDSGIIVDMLEGKANAESLRELLLDAGMDKEILDKMSDKMLVEGYQEVLENKEY